jgi:glycosyltransferase involved in cell wall biosynthesis
MFVVGGLYSKSNGVAWIMRDLADALGRIGLPVEVLGADCYGRGAASIGEIFEEPTKWRTGRGLWLGGLSWSPETKRLIRSAALRNDVIHNHSVWMLPNHYASAAAKKLGKPIAITAHGALEPWAIQNSNWKKKLAGAWFQWRDLRLADCIHVNSIQEMKGIRALGLRQPVAVIPNGVDVAKVAIPNAKSHFLHHFPHLQNSKLILFMARLHRKKGVLNLLDAWAGLSKQFADWHLVIAGPDCGMENELRNRIKEYALQDRATLTGPLDGELKAGALQAASIFALPSFSEGFSMAILEALSVGCPVVLTPGCNFPESVKANAAIEVEPTVGGAESGMRTLMELPESDRNAMGTAARELIGQAYTWDSVARRTKEMYEYLITRRNTPEFIVDN